jgi:DNA-binding transcriptional MerR regulator
VERSGLPHPDSDRADSVQREGRRRDGLLTTGDMARLSSSTLRTVRFYEEAGILHPVQRTEGGHRLFPQAELDKLRLVGDLRAAGFPLDEIRDMLAMKTRFASGAEASREVVERLSMQIDEMSDRIAVLQRVRHQLERARVCLRDCTDCRDEELFPNSCAECTAMTGDAELPNAARVLWNLGR